jgi:hypothetical protein
MQDEAQSNKHMNSWTFAVPGEIPGIFETLDDAMQT